MRSILLITCLFIVYETFVLFGNNWGNLIGAIIFTLIIIYYKKVYLHVKKEQDER